MALLHLTDSTLGQQREPAHLQAHLLGVPVDLVVLRDGGDPRFEIVGAQILGLRRDEHFADGA